MLSKFSVKKPMTVIVGVVLVIILGIISFTSMTTDLLPSIDLPYVAVITAYPGASPEKVELTVTKPLEQVLSTTSGVEEINSISSENSSMVIIQFTQGTNMESAMIEMNGNVDMVKSQLDDEVGTPMLIKINPDMLPIVVASVDFDGKDITETSKKVTEEIIPEFERLDGVASVSGTGIIEESLQISLKQEKIDKLNNRILKSIDGKLSQTKAELDKAEKALQDGKVKFNEESDKQKEKLLEGSMSLSSGKSQVEQGLKLLIQGQEELEKKRDEIKKEKENLEKVIEEQIKAGEETSAEEKLKLTQLSITLEATNKSIEEILKQKKELEKKLSEIIGGEKQLEAGKATLNSELAKAQLQLEESEEAIKKGKEEFKIAEENAYKKAGLDGVISQSSLSSILAAENFSMPAGYITENKHEYLVKVGDQFSNIDEIENLELITLDIEGIGTVKLKDVADIGFINNSHDMYAKINGNDGILLSFQKQSTASTAEVSHDINKTIKKLLKENPDMHINQLSDQGMYIDIVINSVLNNLILGGILAIVILLVFLRDIKPTFIIAMSIPVSLLFAIGLMYFSGVTMNVISLAGLALGVGMLVDNSIVVIENIYRLRSEGMSSAKAAVYGAAQVSGAIFASTLTTICVFLPIVFTQGISRQLFTDMGLTIAYSLIASLIIALTLVPTMSSTLLTNTKEKPHKLFDKIVGIYVKLLDKALNHKIIIIGLVVVLLISSAYSAFSMGTAFMPEVDSNEIMVSIEMPKESTTIDAREMSNKVMDIILTIPDVKTVGAMQGGNGSMGILGGNGSNKAVSMYIILKDERSNTSQQVATSIDEKTKDLNCDITVNSSNMDMSAMGGSGIEILVKGNDLDKLKEIATDLTGILENTEGTIDISNGLKDASEETRITVDKNKALKYGLTVAQVYQQVATAIKNETKSTNITINSNEYPVIVVTESKEELTRETLKDYTIKATVNGEEKEVSLKDISTISEDQALASINHKNQVRSMSVTAGIDNEHNIGLVSRDVESKISSYKLPEGYTIDITGESETINETLGDLIKMISLAIVLIYLIMVAQFQSLLSPLIVMITIPLAFTGGLLALVITGFEISMISMLGFLVLAGIVVNNGIVFVDYVNQLRLQGVDKRSALIETGKARIRPILMTALTTILGLSTLAMGIGMGADMIQPMAIVTIGGLTYATLLTLFIVPIIYDILHRKALVVVEVEEGKNV